MSHVITTRIELNSLRALEEYLEKHGLALATNQEVNGAELVIASKPDWKSRIQGCIVLFVPHDVTSEPDSTSPLGKKIVVRPQTEPVLSKFIAGMCVPFSFVVEDIMPAGTWVWVKDRHIAAAA